VLIFTRKTGEAFLLGDEIRVVILEVRGKQIRIGIEAPADVPVLREEIIERIRAQNLTAAVTQELDLQELAQLWRPK